MQRMLLQIKPVSTPGGKMIGEGYRGTSLTFLKRVKWNLFLMNEMEMSMKSNFWDGSVSSQASP